MWILIETESVLESMARDLRHPHIPGSMPAIIDLWGSTPITQKGSGIRNHKRLVIVVNNRVQANSLRQYITIGRLYYTNLTTLVTCCHGNTSIYNNCICCRLLDQYSIMHACAVHCHYDVCTHKKKGFWWALKAVGMQQLEVPPRPGPIAVAGSRRSLRTAAMLERRRIRLTGKLQERDGDASHENCQGGRATCARKGSHTQFAEIDSCGDAQDC